MKIASMLIATVALSGALMTTAHARDSFGVSINIGGHDHDARHTLRTHRHAPVYYGHYYHQPSVIFYGPSVRHRHYSYNSHRRHNIGAYGHYGNYKRSKAHRKQHHRHDNREHSNRHRR